MLLAATVAAAATSCGAQQPEAVATGLLVLEKSIALADVEGRIDHLAYDPAGRRLFVAELGNGTVDAIDLTSGRVTGRISGLEEPQGLAWLDRIGQLAVATGDGKVGFYDGDGLRPVASLRVGEDADNLRVDPRNGSLVVGFGSGTIATIDPARRELVRSLALPAHPEGFRLDGDHVYVNLPDAGTIAAGDLATGQVTASWSTGLRRLNFPMAFDPASSVIAVAFRLPARLAIVDPRSGTFRQTESTCGDSDDLFFDTRRGRLYVVCGSGDVDIFASRSGTYARVGRVPTRSGARTGLFVPEEDRLYVAARRRDGEPAAILVLRPSD
jgi:DNA-binding beta-propeller fold protein YncE